MPGQPNGLVHCVLEEVPNSGGFGTRDATRRWSVRLENVPDHTKVDEKQSMTCTTTHSIRASLQKGPTLKSSQLHDASARACAHIAMHA